MSTAAHVTIAPSRSSSAPRVTLMVALRSWLGSGSGLGLGLGLGLG